jgi:hypothetical protein
MKRTAFVAVSLLVLIAVVVLPASSMQRGRGAPPAPTNLQVLPEGIDIRMVMQNISGALGVQCTFCHVQGDFASDDIDKKNIARGMMRMLQGINNDYLANVPAREGREGAARTSCMMCHRGAAIPSTE